MKIAGSRPTLILGLLTLLTAFGAGAQGDQEGAKAAGSSNGIARVVGQMWWNQDKKVTALGLTDEQRGNMDTIGRAYLEGRRAARTGQSDAFARFSESLQQGDWSTANDRAKAMAEESGKPLLAQGEMMVEVLRLLSAEQRQKLAADFPGIFKGPWMRSGANVMRQRRAARGQ